MTQSLLNAFIDAAHHLRDLGFPHVATYIIELSHIDASEGLTEDDLETIRSALRILRGYDVDDADTIYELSALVQP